MKGLKITSSIPVNQGYLQLLHPHCRLQLVSQLKGRSRLKDQIHNPPELPQVKVRVKVQATKLPEQDFQENLLSHSRLTPIAFAIKTIVA